MLKLYFVRHGETMSNVWGYIQGWSDTPLTDKGIVQGKAVGEMLKDTNFLALYTSTSERAYDTASLINVNHHLPIQMYKGLKEMNFGSMEAHPEHIVGGTPAHRMNYDWTIFGGENIDILTQRMSRTLKELVENHKGETGNILCVSHSIAILAALRSINQSLYDNRMAEGEYIDNCSVTTILWDGVSFTIERINQK